MRLSKPKLAHQPYQCRLAPYTVKVVAVGSYAKAKVGWHVKLFFNNGTTYYDGGLVKTLGQARSAATRFWLRLRLIAINCLIGKAADSTFRVLYQSCQESLQAGPVDDLAPVALRDWLEDRGFTQVREWIIVPGRKARVQWPAGWDIVASTS